jgi:ATP-binding cassette, subfamily B, bacterial
MKRNDERCAVTLTWRRTQVAAGLAEMVRQLRWERPGSCVDKVAWVDGETDSEHHLCRIATSLRVELKHTSSRFVSVDGVLRQLGPSVVDLSQGEDHVYLLILDTNRRHALVLTPALRRQKLPLAHLRELVTAGAQATVASSIDAWLTCVNPSPKHRDIRRRKVATVILENAPIEGLYVLRRGPCDSTLTLLREQGILRLLGWTGLVSVLHVCMGLIGWMLLGAELSTGPLEGGWMDAWIMTQATTVLLQLIVAALGCQLVTKLTLFLKQRMLLGTLRLDTEHIRHHGSGHWLGMVFEANVLESAGLAGSFAGLLAVFQLGSAAALVWLGANGGLQLCLMLVWSILLATLIARLAAVQTSWTGQRLKLAQHFVENLIGNRTRIVQQSPSEWHLREDTLLSEHLDSNQRMDAVRLLLTTLASRGWMVVSLVSLSAALLFNETNTFTLAITLGGALQAQMAFGAIGGIAPALVSAAVAWHHLSGLFKAAESAGLEGPTHSLPNAPTQPKSGAMVLDMQDVGFAYSRSATSILNGCNLRILAGERLLLEGSSGSGKSTLASMLSGLRQPSRGHILLDGYDYRTLGANRWSKRIATAPQFHENHVLSASLAFNLLMGRAWPPSSRDLEEAEEVCRSLDLGALLDRMPSGIHQAVGDTGWQLSHGERSRVFLARALLQGAHTVVLDESFGALDAKTLERCLTAVFERTPTLVVIAHP